MNFRELCNCFKQTACVVSIEKEEKNNREIRIVDGNDVYVNSFNSDFYAKHVFIPNSIYTDYLEKNLNFEEYCYRSAIKKELLHSYAYPEHFHAWMHMLFIPIECEDEKLAYCLYIMEINDVFNPELHSAGRDDNFHLFPFLVAEQPFGNGGGDRDFHLLQVRLCFRHDGVDKFPLVGQIGDLDG